MNIQYVVQQHGLSITNRREYNSWHGARYRCSSFKHPKWADYGGRGITMCDRWANSFALFLQDMGPRPMDAELDRIDNDGNYEPGNCRWITHQANSHNRRAGPSRPKKVRPRKPRVARAISAADRLRLARLDRIRNSYAVRLRKLEARIVVLEGRFAQRRASALASDRALEETKQRRLVRIDQALAVALKRPLDRIAAIEAEIAAKQAPIIAMIRPEFRPSV